MSNKEKIEIDFDMHHINISPPKFIFLHNLEINHQGKPKSINEASPTATITFEASTFNLVYYSHQM